MKTPARITILAATALWLTGCIPAYTLVKPAPMTVAARTMEVHPTTEWNRAPWRAIPQEESWTQNGLMLDSISFIGGIEDGATIIRQNAKSLEKVPAFRASMTPQDLVSMIESYYRIRGVSVFNTLSIGPVKFVGEDGVQFDYEFVLPDQVKRRGRAVMAISQNKLYLMNLNGVAVHYFDAALPEFQALVASARVPGQKS